MASGTFLLGRDRTVKPIFMLLRLRISVVAFTLTLSLLSITLSISAQKLKKADKTTRDNLEMHIRYLSGDPGGNAGGSLPKATDYISSAFSQAGLQPKGDRNGWLQAFTIDEGRQISPDSYLTVNDRPFLLNKEYFPLAYSAATTASGSPAIALQERGEPWFMDLKEILESGSGNPHFDLEETIREQVAVCAKKGATALILYNSSSKLSDKLAYDPGVRPVAVSIPVIYITREAKRKYLKDESASLDIKLKVGFVEKSRTEHNVVGFLDNGAATTVVIGAHYDYGDGGMNAAKGANGEGGTKGEGSTKAEGSAKAEGGANGVADNVSGVAAAVELARMLKDSKLKGNNYLFVAFAGEQKEMRGSGYFVEHLPVDESKVNYLIDMDRIGWLSDSSHLLMIGGNSTSLVWGTVCNKVVDKKMLSLQFDGYGAGDPVIFYRKGIPLLFFCTGACSPGGHLTAGGIDKINYMGELQVLKFVYSIIQNINGMGRIAFTKTKEPGL